MRTSRRINYKVLSETGGKEGNVDGQPGEVETVEADEISNLLRSISISADKSDGLDRTREGGSMDKHRTDAIKVELSTIADNTEHFIDENEIDENSVKSVVDCKTSQIEELRTSYRKLHKDFAWNKLWGVIF